MASGLALIAIWRLIVKVLGRVETKTRNAIRMMAMTSRMFDMFSPLFESLSTNRVTLKQVAANGKGF